MRSAPASLWLAVICAALASLPVLVARYPQMTDYPAHLARYHVMINLHHSADLARFYAFDWMWTGNLGADLLIRPLAALLGVEAAGWLIVALIPALTGLAILSVEWVLRRRIGLGSYLAFAFIWSPSLLLGFLNFTLSLALALFAFAGWVALEGKRWRAALFLPAALVVWLCHVSGWGILGLMVFGYEWSRRKGFAAFWAPWPLTLPMLPLVFGGSGAGAMSYGSHVDIYKWAIWMRAMRDRFEWLDKGSLILVLLVVLGAFALRRIDGRLGWGALIVLLGSIAIPRHIAGGDYADYRMISSGLLLACLAIDVPLSRAWLWLAPLLFAGRLGVTTVDWYSDSRRAENYLAVLDHVPQGARIASVVAVPRGEWRFNTFEHIAGYAVVRRDAQVNAMFALPHVHMLRLREPGAFRDPSQRLFQRQGQRLKLADFAPATRADWLWYIGPTEPASLPAGAVVTWRGQHTLLARLAKAADRR